MPRLHIRHNEPIWETTGFEVDLPRRWPSATTRTGGTSLIILKIYRGDVVVEGQATISPSARVSTMDGDREVRPTESALRQGNPAR